MIAINRAKRETSLDFYEIELSVLELAVHYVFYCLGQRESPMPRFRKMTKTQYINELKQFAKLGQMIRVGKSRLSPLVRESEIRVGEAKLAKLIEKLEATNEF